MTSFKFKIFRHYFGTQGVTTAFLYWRSRIWEREMESQLCCKWQRGCGIVGLWKVEYSIFFWKMDNGELLTSLRLLCMWAPRAAVWSGHPGTNQHQSGWQGWKRIDGKGWAGRWHLEDVTQWEGGEFGKQDKHRKVANSKQKCCWVERKRTMQKQGLKINKGGKLS